MKKVGSGGLPPALQQLIKDAAHSDKKIGAPKLHKALHGNHLGQLKHADKNQLRDIFEHLTPKARAMVEKLLHGGTQSPGGIGSIPGAVKIKMDEPTATTQSPGGIGSIPGAVKIKMDEPTATTQSPGGIGSLPGVVKIKMDEPTATTTQSTGGLGSIPGVVKIKMDEPTATTTQSTGGITTRPQVVKIKMDEPTGF